MMMLVKFLHNRHRRVGCVVAKKLTGDLVGVGWSRCSAGDRWDRAEALRLAVERAERHESFVTGDMAHVENVPQSVHPEALTMADRAHRYFFGHEPVAVGGEPYLLRRREDTWSLLTPDGEWKADLYGHTTGGAFVPHPHGDGPADLVDFLRRATGE